MSSSSQSYFEAETLDDLLRLAGKETLEHGTYISPTKGDARELTGVLLELRDPRARLSRSETRGKLFSALGHLCWYLAANDAAKQMAYYIDWYEKRYDPDESVADAYGPRLFAWGGINQIQNVITRLTQVPSSRRAVVQLFSRDDLQASVNSWPHDPPSVPCTCTLQFLVRDEHPDALHLVAYMRSNDWNYGLPHDVFCFTMLQEIVARALGVRLGCYKHMVGSLHAYEEHSAVVKQYLDEGWQPTTNSMPNMPKGDPATAIRTLLKAERSLREGDGFDQEWQGSVDDYWADLIRLLGVYRAFQNDDPRSMETHREALTSDVYRAFVDGKLRELRAE